MAHKLVIVESPKKAQMIGGYLGSGYVVESSIGHIRDLPNNAADTPAKIKDKPWGRLAVDVDNGFEPYYVVPRDKKSHIAKLKKLLEAADEHSLDAFGVHGVGGTLGAVLTGVFAYSNPQPIAIDIGVTRFEAVPMAVAFAVTLALGWLLGGTVGIGTVAYAFGIGPLVQLFVRLTPDRVLAALQAGGTRGA